MELTTIKQNWANRGFSFGIWDDPAGQVWEDFVHTVDELFMLVEGQVELIVCGRRLIPLIGEEVLIPAGTSHTVHTLDERASRWFYGYKVNEKLRSIS